MFIWTDNEEKLLSLVLVKVKKTWSYCVAVSLLPTETMDNCIFLSIKSADTSVKYKLQIVSPGCKWFVFSSVLRKWTDAYVNLLKEWAWCL